MSKSKIKYTLKRPRNQYIIFLFILIIPVAYFVIFIMNSDKVSPDNASDYLIGTWNRTDGDYSIKISKVKDDGTLAAGYFNPQPINVGRTGWRIQENVLQVFVLLDDLNYPGSYYDLSYDKETETLNGTYYQATMKQTYQVSFQMKQ